MAFQSRGAWTNRPNRAVKVRDSPRWFRSHWLGKSQTAP